MRVPFPLVFLAALVLAGSVVPPARSQGAGTLKRESFDRDPGWDGRNNQARQPEPRLVKQDFGWSATRHLGLPGEVGGLITPCAEPAYYGKRLPALTLDQPLAASGKLVMPPGANHFLLGFFNRTTVNEWRTPNTLAFRINGRGERFHAHVEYCTAKWRAGADFFGAVDGASGRKQQRLFPCGDHVYTWSLRYDPAGNGGAGTVTATVDGETLTFALDAGHKADGALFNRFGLLPVSKSVDGGGEAWIGSLEIHGVREPLDRDPHWEGFHNRESWTSGNVRPRFDFGFSPTRYAGGKGTGEVGGQTFRGDERSPQSMAYYGDRVGPFTLDQPLRASGRACMRRGVSDSTTLFGFFHSEGSTRVSQAQQSGFPENFLGLAVEGPSREGFYFYPAYGVDREAVSNNALSAREAGEEPPHLLPDGRSHAWELVYDPAGSGQLRVTLDGKGVTLALTPEHRAIGARFDRFGLVTTHIDGNGQEVYFDDLEYTAR